MCCTHAFLMNLSRLAPRNVYSATSGPLPEIVTENVPDANLELVVRSEIRHRMEGLFGQSKRCAKGQSYMETFCLQNVHLGARRGPSVLLQLCLSQLEMLRRQFQPPYLLLRFLLILLFLFYQSLQKD